LLRAASIGRSLANRAVGKISRENESASIALFSETLPALKANETKPISPAQKLLLFFG
jgi:hypothetical protein